MPAGEHEVSFRSGGEKIFGTLRPAKGRGRRPVAILVHGFGSFRDELTGFVELAGRLSAAGVASLRLDMRGCGKSGTRGVMRPMWDWVEDLRNAVSFCETVPGLAPDRIGVVGMSMGGGIATIGAALDDRIRAVAALAPVADGEDWFRHLWSSTQGEAGWRKLQRTIAEDRRRSIARPSKMVSVLDAMSYQEADRQGFRKMSRTYPQFLKRIALSAVDSAFRVRAIPLAPLVAPRPLLVVHSRADTSVPVRQGEALFAAAGETRRLVLLDDSPHCFWIGADSLRVQEEAAGWMRRHL
jgi:pimeloyl-ACP methyl ester carboxylesterase